MLLIEHLPVYRDGFLPDWDYQTEIFLNEVTAGDSNKSCARRRILAAQLGFDCGQGFLVELTSLGVILLVGKGSPNVIEVGCDLETVGTE